MARRFGTEKVLIATANVTSAGSPLTLVSGVADNIHAPKELCIAGGAAAASVTLTQGAASGLFLTLSVPIGDTVCVLFPDGLELSNGNEIDIVTDQTVDATLYYCTYDESAGVTKVQSRANTFASPITTRAPSNVVGQDKS